MSLVREDVYAALWEAASQAADFVTVARRLRHWSDVSPAEQPALFMTQTKMMAQVSQQTNLPVTWMLHAEFYIYVHSTEPYLAPAMVLNPLIDSVVEALCYDLSGSAQQLGMPERVRWVRINGEIATAEGVLGDQELAIIPVEILCV